MWHVAQATLSCPLVSINPVVLWSNVAVVQLIVVWHVVQLARPKAGPADGCTGFVVCCHVVKWHPEFPQSVDATTKL
jgi:hypothetical protein